MMFVDLIDDGGGSGDFRSDSVTAGGGFVFLADEWY